MDNTDLVVGVDEAGRGPWAGPLTAACVLTSEECEIEGVLDSKVLSGLRRRELQKTIKQNAIAIGIGWASAREIDAMGLQQATIMAMERAYRQLPAVKARVVVDGNINYLNKFEGSESLVRADASVESVSAASIIAKCHRDSFMERMDVLFPEYGFASHKGYGTKEHSVALEIYGPCMLHRRSFSPIAKQLGAQT